MGAIAVFVGMRTIKTALAVAISAYLGIWLNLESPFFAAIAALITMQGNLRDSFRMARYRVLGTIFGATMGIIGSYLAPGHPLILGLGVALIIFVSDKFHWNKAIAIASIVFTSIMLSSEGGPIYASLHRVLDTSVGIMVAVVINYTISRPLSRDRVMQNAQELIQKCKTVLGMLVCQEQDITLADIEARMQEIEQELPGLKAEMRMQLVRTKTETLNFDIIKGKIDSLYWHIAVLRQLPGNVRLNIKNARLVNNLYQVNLSGTDELDDEETVFNYHLGQSLGLLQELAGIFIVTEPEDEKDPHPQ